MNVTEGETRCLEFNPISSKLYESDSCQLMYQFICKRELKKE